MYLFTAGMGIGLTGLQAAQNGINVTGQNITNINTPGYARQRLNLQTGFAVKLDKLQFGLGVNVSQVQAIRDRFLDMQLTQTITRQAGTTTRYEGVESISSLFQEAGESGLNIELQRFLQSFQELAARPEDDAVRTNAITRAQTMISGLKARYELIQDKVTQANRTVVSLATEINTITDQIAKLNHQIATEIVEGMDNNARDQRQGLVNKLAELVGIQVFEDDQGRMTITVENGMPIVSGTRAMRMITNDLDDNGNYKVEIEIGSLELPPTGSGQYTKIDVTKAIQSGTMGGTLDLRDNVLPEYLSNLDQLAANVVQQVNNLHIQGYGLDTPVGGELYFFVGATGDNASVDPVTGLPYDPVTNLPVNINNNYHGMVRSLYINTAILDNPRLIATANAAGEPGNNEIARQLGELQNTSEVYYNDRNGVMVTVGPFSTFINSVANKIGNLALRLQSNAITDENIRVALETQRDRLSAVDYDEEATNLMVYQRSYQACTRFINVIDQLTDQLINNLGR
jgi:flagellar hook-associated protein 1 FlgK